jgi:hypothetical protein
LLVDPRQTELFAERLYELLTDDAAIAKLHRWQRDNIDQYDIGTVGMRITDIYNGQIARLMKKSNNKLHG